MWQSSLGQQWLLLGIFPVSPPSSSLDFSHLGGFSQFIYSSVLLLTPLWPLIILNDLQSLKGCHVVFPRDYSQTVMQMAVDMPRAPLCKKTENPLPLRRMVHVIGILSILYTLITVFRRHISQGLRYKETLERFGNNNFLPQLSRERLFPFLPFLENYCPFHVSTHWKTTFIKRHKEKVKICQIPSLHHLSKM